MPLKVLAALLGFFFMAYQWELPAAAQERVTKDMLGELSSKVELQRQAYWRYASAEQEAQEDNSPERAAVYREAKIKAYDAYMELSAQLQKITLEYREQQKHKEDMELSR